MPARRAGVSDPITDQEIAFAHLIMSGTMNDRRAAEALGLNPETAASLKSKPRVRAYIIEHRGAENLLRNRNLGRDRILTRLWELAALSSEATRGSITGQMKALSMIAAIEGLIPDRRLSPSATPSNAQIGESGWRPEDQPASASASTKPVAPRIPQPPLDHNAGQLNPFVIPQPLNRVPATATDFFDVALDAINSANSSYSANPNRFAQSR